MNHTQKKQLPMKRLEEIARRLMRDVYCPMSACVCLKEGGGILSVHLFDTVFCCVPEEAVRPCGRMVLISLHPDGDLRVMEADKANLRRIGTLSGTDAQLLIYSEYTGLRPVDAQDACAGKE